MTIGVFGDSYAYAMYPNKAVCWFDLLATKLNDKCVTYGVSGSSLYYSYKKFIKLHDRYDLKIFLVTSPNRYTKEVRLTERRLPYHVTSIPHIEHLSNSGHATPSDLEVLNNLRGWFESYHEEYEYDMIDFMLDKIESYNDNTIIIPCFDNSFTKKRFDKYNLDPDLHPLHNIWHRQLDLLGIDPEGRVLAETEIMCGHLSPEWNVFLADLLYTRITTGKWDYSGFYDVKMKYPANYYYNL